jgi:uncharacterized protein YbaR (Trm112 family)
MKMIHRELKLFLDNKAHPLPPWITFAFSLGAFLHEKGVKDKKNANIVVSLPSEQYFTLFVAVGIADKIFSARRELHSIRQQILSLNKGSRIIYQDHESARKASVVSVEPSPVIKGEFILFIQDGNIQLGVPERQWMEKIILLEEEFPEIKRRRRVGKNHQIRISSSFMKTLYSEEQLSKASFYPGDNFYIVGDKENFIEMLSETCFFINGQKGTIGDFLYIENLQNNNSYFNGKFFSSRMKNTYEINDNVPVLFSDTLSYRKQIRLFAQNPSLIVIGRSEHENHIHDVVSDVTRRIILGDTEMITNEIVNYIEDYGASIPAGIELFAWREQQC